MTRYLIYAVLLFAAAHFRDVIACCQNNRGELDLSKLTKSNSDASRYTIEHGHCKITLNFSSDSHGEAVTMAKNILLASLHQGTIYQNNNKTGCESC